jgi:hypothetical protein
MADRDLRALDMRHTLPNLKNLLLTLTDGEGAQLRYVCCVASPFDVFQFYGCSISRSFNSAELSVTGLESPRAESPVENGSTTPKPVYSVELPAEGNTPPASGSTTPTTEIGKKSRSFIGLSPIAGFLRARYPSAIRAVAVKPVSEMEAAEGSEPPTVADGGADPEDDEDRRTIRGDAATDAALDGAAVKGTNGVERGSEKLGEVPAHTPALTPPPVTPVK